MPWQEWCERRRFADWRLGIRSDDEVDEDVDFG
jgi:hypothetical protein